jgi:hypothetical protein
VRPSRRLITLAALISGLAAMASCRAVHPLEIADGCRCSPSEYCHVRPPSGREHTARIECLAMPRTCGDPPTCACLGRPIDACREELGAFTVIEPRAVSGCDDCATEEYCWHETGAAPMCRLLPARCESSPTCACLTEARSLRPVSCNERNGRIEASLVQ